MYKLYSSNGLEARYTTAFYIYMEQDLGELHPSVKDVANLMEQGGLMDKGYKLHTDNWYLSLALFHYLQVRKTYAYGMAKTNCRYMP